MAAGTRSYLTSPPDIAGMPPGIPYIVGNEAAERFSFYGMKAVLTVFMTQHLVDVTGAPAPMTDEEAKYWVHLFVFAVYFTPFFGALLADWLLGKYRTIMLLSLVYCGGHAVLALLDLSVARVIAPRTLLFGGLALIALGAGGIKPCVSAHVGDQFGNRNSGLLEKVFGWFYFSINLGATASMLLTPLLMEWYGPSIAFGVPGVLMAIATIVFWMGRNVFVHIPPSGNRFFEETFSKEGIAALVNLIPLFLFVAMFWSLFDQTASAWVLQAEKMDRSLPSSLSFLGTEILASQIQAANGFFVLLLIPTFTYLLYPLMGRLFTVTPLRKVGIGLFLTVAAFSVSGLIESSIALGGRPHILWQLVAYLVLTCGEILVSITVLEFSYTQAPKTMKSSIMALYLSSVAVGNLFTAIVNGVLDARKKAGHPALEGADYYWFFTGCMLVVAVIFVLWSPFYRGRRYIQSADEAAGPAGEV